MEWVLFIVVFLFILSFVMRDPTPKDSNAHRENLSKAADHDRSRRHDDLMFDDDFDASKHSFLGNIFHHHH